MNNDTELVFDMSEVEEKERLLEQLLEERAELNRKLIDAKSRWLTLSKRMNIGRNDLCLCGSGKKHKKCCLTMVLSS